MTGLFGLGYMCVLTCTPIRLAPEVFYESNTDSVIPNQHIVTKKYMNNYLPDRNTNKVANKFNCHIEEIYPEYQF
jgi:hypothetical protein